MFSRNQEYRLLYFFATHKTTRYCIYGAGKFTKDMMLFVNRNNLPAPDFIFDDNPGTETIPPLGRIIRKDDADFKNIDTVILGSDVWQDKMKSNIDPLNLRSTVLDLSPSVNDSADLSKIDRIKTYFENGMIPWTEGFWDYRNDKFRAAINSEEILAKFRARNLGDKFGLRLDDRIVEYPWLFSKLPPGPARLLDAGSILNFDYIVEHKTLSKKNITIVTLAPEGNCFFNKAISYLYEDLRQLPLKNGTYDEIVCISTLEHIGMDNSIYGEKERSANPDDSKPSYSYLSVVEELLRVLKPGGCMYITVPYGKFENHGFFQQFDRKMLAMIFDLFKNSGSFSLDFFRYFPDGWSFVSQDDCDDAESFNPHTGRGKKDDFAAHSRGICAITFNKM